jgi:hypothetical protein
MTTAASLNTPAVTAQPGGRAEIPLQVHNSGSTVEEYRFEVVGPAVAWTTVEPESLRLYPQNSGTVLLSLSPPRSSEVPAGEIPFGVRVVPTSTPEGTVVPEGVVTVLPFAEVTGELVPRRFGGVWRGRTNVAIDNRSNVPLTVRLTAQGDSSRVRLGFSREDIQLPLGTAELSKLTARPAKRLWRGAPVVHPFQVVATPAGEAPHEPVLLDGTYQQEAILPSWLPRALITALAAVLALVGLWFALLRPVVKSAAREETQKQVAQALPSSPDPAKSAGGGATSGASPGAGGAPNAGAGAGAGAGASGGGGGSPTPDASAGTSAGARGGAGGGGGTGGSGGVGGVGEPKSAQDEIKDSVGGDPTTGTVYRVPESQLFELTDLVVQNPQGDSGNVVIATEGRTLLRLALQNFRDQDYHFVTPIVVSAEGRITMTVTCRAVGRPVSAPTPAKCAESLLVGGTLRAAPAPSATSSAR